MTLDGTINSDYSIELGVGVILELDDDDYEPDIFMQGNTNDSRWTIYRFNASTLLSGTKTVIALGIGGGHNIDNQSITLPLVEYNVNFVAGANGSLTGTTSFTNILDGTAWGSAGITVPNPVPASGYQFDGWSPVYPATIEEDLTFTASFSLTPVNPVYWDVNFVAGANGSLTGTTSFTNILDGTAWGSAGITVPNPVPASGYQFDGWSPVYPATIEEDLTFTASFSLIPVQPPVIITTVTTYEVNFLTGEGGSLEGTTEITTVAGTVWSLIDVPTPVADEGYEFVEWDNEFPTNIYQDWTFTARFRVIDNEEIIDDEEIPEVTPEPEVDKEEPEDTVVIDDEETPEVTPQPTLPATSYASTGLITGLGVALMGLGFALRKRYK